MTRPLLLAIHPSRRVQPVNPPVVAAIGTPAVLIYQGWTYSVFRKRIGSFDADAAD